MQSSAGLQVWPRPSALVPDTTDIPRGLVLMPRQVRAKSVAWWIHQGLDFFITSCRCLIRLGTREFRGYISSLSCLLPHFLVHSISCRPFFVELLVFPVLTRVFSGGSNFLPQSKDMQVKVPAGDNSGYPFLCFSFSPSIGWDWLQPPNLNLKKRIFVILQITYI